MTRIFIEAQYDPRRRVMLLQASTGFGGDVYRVTARDVTREEGIAQAVAFAKMYRDNGAEVVTR